MMRATRILFLYLAVAAGCGRPSPAPDSPADAAHPAPPAGAPRLVVVLVVDGLSWERLDTWRPWLTAGIGRLLAEGAVASACRYEQLNTETGPGHASLLTGSSPRIHGIALNQWYLPLPDGSRMTKVLSGSQPLEGEAESSSRTVPGPGRLRAKTYGDALVERDPRSRVVSLSIKDRSAIFLAGRHARHAVYWYASESGTMVTSPVYDPSAPVVAAMDRFNRDNAGARLGERYGRTWSRLPLPATGNLPQPEDDLQPFQDPVAGTGFPKDPSKASRPLASLLPWTPAADRLLSDLALDLLGDPALALGRDASTDVLAISFAAHDYAAHYYGAESVESLEILRALDFEIARLLETLSTRLGREHVVVALSSDHGMLPIPEPAKRRDPSSATERIEEARLRGALNDVIERETGARGVVHRMEACSMWLDRVALGQPGAPQEARVLDIVERELATTWGSLFERTFRVASLAGDRGDDPLASKAWNACVPGRSGDLFVVPRPGVFIDPHGGKGTNHGAPWDYDAHVPLILWGGGIPARVLDVPCTPYDLAPTLAGMTGTPLPAATGRVLPVR